MGDGVFCERQLGSLNDFLQIWRISHFKADSRATKVHPTLEVETGSWQDSATLYCYQRP
jgi:hypothetical protein